MKHVWEELWTQTFWFWALEMSTKTLKTFEHFKAPLKLFISVHSKEITQEITMFTLEWNLMNTSYEVFEEMTWGHFVITVDYRFVCVCAHLDGFPPEQSSLPESPDKMCTIVKVQIIYTFGSRFCQCVCSLWIKPIILVSTNWASDVGISSEL